MGGLGVSARLRDVARFGLLVLEDGVAIDGRPSRVAAAARLARSWPASPLRGHRLGILAARARER